MKDPKNIDSIKIRLETGKISRVITTDDLLQDNPPIERLFGRLEAYLSSGAIINRADLEQIFEKYPLTKEQYKCLDKAYEVGIIEGLIQEKDKDNLKIRIEAFVYLFDKAHKN